MASHTVFNSVLANIELKFSTNASKLGSKATPIMDPHRHTNLLLALSHKSPIISLLVKSVANICS